MHKRKLGKLKKIDFGKGSTSLWIIKRALKIREAQYSVLKVEIDNNLKKRLKKIVISKIQESNEITEYSFVTEDQDDQVYELKTSETDFDEIKKEIDRGSEAKKVKDLEDLLNSWSYVVKIQHDKSAIYGCRKISTLWNTKKVTNFSNLIFENQILIDLSGKPIFHIDSKLDFLSFEDTLFIINKKGFESAMNFRVGMENNRDEVIEDFKKFKIFDDVEVIKNEVGNNLRFLRKISLVKKSGYYKDFNFMNKLIELNNNNGWGLKVSNNKIVVSDGCNINLILTLLNNDRLASQINEEVFDVGIKKKIEGN